MVPFFVALTDSNGSVYDIVEYDEQKYGYRLYNDRSSGAGMHWLHFHSTYYSVFGGYSAWLESWAPQYVTYLDPATGPHLTDPAWVAKNIRADAGQMNPMDGTLIDPFSADGGADNKTTDLTSTKNFQAGLIAQEIYYEVPELRFIVTGGPTNETNTEHINISDSNIQTDPDYSNWGSETAGVLYTQLIPYLIAHNKIQQDEINNLQTTVSTLETQVNTYKNIIDKLTTSNSFKNFKNSL